MKIARMTGITNRTPFTLHAPENNGGDLAYCAAIAALASQYCPIIQILH
jgi:hypothetical protein